MYHLLPACTLVLISLGVLSYRYTVEKAYLLLASMPTIVFLVGMADEFFRGIRQLNHQLLHVAYDTSYALLLLGIILTLRAVIKRRLIMRVAAGTCIAGIPLGYLFVTHR